MWDTHHTGIHRVSYRRHKALSSAVSPFQVLQMRFPLCGLTVTLIIPRSKYKLVSWWKKNTLVFWLLSFLYTVSSADREHCDAKDAIFGLVNPKLYLTLRMWLVITIKMEFIFDGSAVLVMCNVCFHHTALYAVKTCIRASLVMYQKRCFFLSIQ